MEIRVEYMSDINYNVGILLEEAMKMAKVGRPKSEDPKKERITVRLETETAERLSAYAEKLGLTKSEVVTQVLKSVLEEKDEQN